MLDKKNNKKKIMNDKNKMKLKKKPTKKKLVNKQKFWKNWFKDFKEYWNEDFCEFFWNEFQKKVTRNILITIVVALICAVGISTTVSKRLILKSQLQNKEIVSINLNKILNDFSINLAKTDKKDGEFDLEIKYFATLLEYHLKEIAESRNIIIIPSKVAIAGVKDWTDTFKLYIDLKSQYIQFLKKENLLEQEYKILKEHMKGEENVR